MMLLNLRKYWFGGPLAVWRREISRKKILETAPTATGTAGPWELHVLTGKADWQNLIWALKSFYDCLENKYQAVVHDDGTLSSIQLGHLAAHFPNARIIGRPEADNDMREFLKNHPRCWKFRQDNYLAQKVFDLHYYLKADKMLLIDSDILFFSKPAVLLERAENPEYHLNTLNKNWKPGYALPDSELEAKFGVKMIEDINSGLGIIQRGTLNIDWIEEWLGDAELVAGHPHRIEQTLIAVCCCRAGYEMLPAEYDVHAGRSNFSNPVRHYIGPVRPLMYTEGMPRIKSRFGI